jgi:serine/threonine protein kinase
MLPVADSNLEEYLSLAEETSAPSYAARIRGWFGCLITAVQYLHSNHIRHRDIKPANILVHGCNVLFVDFELALDWKDLAQSTTTTDCGKTPLYAAPEVIQHKKRNSTSDIWSLGCVFLEMVTVLKGKSIAQLREHFTALTESPLFFNNHNSIQDWISLLEKLSSIDNAPLLWIKNMVQPDRTLRSRAATILDAIGHSHADGSQPNPYFGQCCQREDKAIRSQIRKCVRCAVDIPKVGNLIHSLPAS